MPLSRAKLRKQLRTFIRDLQPRERLIVGIAVSLSCFVLAYAVIFIPMTHLMTWSQERAERDEQALQTADRLLKKYDMVYADLGAVEEAIQSSERGNLLTTLENLSKSSAISVNSMKPQAGAKNDAYTETRVKVDLKAITLAQLIQYLHEIESAPQHITIKTLSIRTLSKNPGKLDASFSVSSFDPV
jgi:type II secretory pathway component PulM